MNSYTAMFKCMGAYLHAVEEVQPPPLHPQLGDSWWGHIFQEWHSFMKEHEVPENILAKAQEVLECFEMGYTHLSEAAQIKEQDEVETKIQELLLKPQSVQRTEEWYREMREVLSASEFYQLFSSPRQRGQLVLSKVVPPETQEPHAPPRKCCLTMEMTPLDWGIRFEPVAKMFLESFWKASIAEMGRLHHPSRKGLAASPDGLITDAANKELIGDLVEIKCPPTREIGKIVPPNYWYQTQHQMEVSQRHICQYSEFCFRSLTAAKPTECQAPPKYVERGVLFVVQNEKQPEMKYVYGPLGDMDWKPPEEEGWEIVERVPWYLEKFWIQPVARDEAWFQSIIPLIDEFWADVAKARKGEFVVPESSVKRKAAACAIVD